MTTPAGERREELTAYLDDHRHQSTVFGRLVLAVGTTNYNSMSYDKREHGGGEITVVDLCNVLDLAKLEKVARQMGWRG